MPLNGEPAGSGGRDAEWPGYDSTISYTGCAAHAGAPYGDGVFGIEQERRRGPRLRDRAVAIAHTKSDAQPDSVGLLGECVGVAWGDDTGSGWPLPVLDWHLVELRVDGPHGRGLGRRVARLRER